MKTSKSVVPILAAIVMIFSAVVTARADHLLNIKTGEPFPTFKLPTIEQGVLDSADFKGSVVVLVCLSAEQRSSELAAMDSREVVKALGTEPVRLAHLSADVVQKAYFERFRQERGLDVQLAFDADRVFYRQLGLIVYPTTIVVNKEGKLAHVLALHGADYARTLDAYVRNALGKMTDEQLQEFLKTKTSPEGSPKSTASAHRARARVAREKGQMDEAKSELNMAREQDPSNADILLDLADIDLVTANIDDADKLIDSVLQTQPEQRRAKQLKGIVLFRQNKLKESEVILLEALNLNPDPSRVHYYLGRIYETQGNTAKALEHYREALKRALKETN